MGRGQPGPLKPIILGRANFFFFHHTLAQFWIDLNKKYAEKWPNISEQGKPCADKDKWANKPDKLSFLSETPAE